MKSLIPMDDYGVFVDKHDTARVDSRYVAQFFEKQHKHVLRDIANSVKNSARQILCPHRIKTVPAES